MGAVGVTLPVPFPACDSGLRWVTGWYGICWTVQPRPAPDGCPAGLSWVRVEGDGAWLARVVLVMGPVGGCLFLILLSCGISRGDGRTWPRWNGRSWRAGTWSWIWL